MKRHFKIKDFTLDDVPDNGLYIFGSLTKLFGGGGSSGRNAASAANQFYDKAISEMRRQFDKTQANIQPYLDAGVQALPSVIEGSTVEGLNERLGRIFNTDIFNNLRNQREESVRGQYSAAGLNRSGNAVEDIADIPQSIGLALEELLTGRATQLAGSGQNAAANLGSLGQSTSGAIANLFANQGNNLSSGIITDAQADAQATQNFMETATTLASVFFSDPSIKTNIKVIDVVHTDRGDLDLCDWDWIDAANDTIIKDFGTTGFMADQVEKLYPEHVAEYCGFKVINYSALIQDLEEAA
jgi:hypothetical protein